MLWVSNSIGDRALGFVTRVQKHLTATSGRFYNCRPGRRDAVVGQEVFVVCYGRLPYYPSVQDIEPIKRSEVVFEWMKSFGRKSRKITTDIPKIPASTNATFNKAEKDIWFCEHANYSPEDLEEVHLFSPIEVQPGATVDKRVPAPDSRSIETDQAEISMGCCAKQPHIIYMVALMLFLRSAIRELGTNMIQLRS